MSTEEKELPLRLRLFHGHPVFGGPDAYRSLFDHEKIEADDQMAYVSILMNLSSGGSAWTAVCEEFIGKTVKRACEEDEQDVDACERVFRRRTDKRIKELEAELRAVYNLLEDRRKDLNCCPKHPKGERCALPAGHKGGCKWGGGD